MRAPAAGFEARVRDSFGRQPLMVTLGASLARVAPGEVEVAMPWSAHITQQNGFVHAGAIGAIADSACGYAALTLMAPGQNVLTIEYKLNLMSPAAGETFSAIGRVIRAGRRITVTQAEVFTVSAETRKLIAVMQATMMAVEEAAAN